MTLNEWRKNLAKTQPIAREPWHLDYGQPMEATPQHVTFEMILDNQQEHINKMRKEIDTLTAIVQTLKGQMESGPCGQCGRWLLTPGDYLCNHCRGE